VPADTAPLSGVVATSVSLYQMARSRQSIRASEFRARFCMNPFVRRSACWRPRAKPRAWLAGGILAFAVTLAGAAQAASDVAPGSASGLPVPRFVSIKPDRVNVRSGPTRDHEVAFVFTRAGLPVEITAESDNWRRIRDVEGAEGWVYHSMLSGRRMAQVTAKQKGELVPLYEKPDGSALVARLQAGVLGSVKQCSGTWCRIAGTGFDGWITQDRLWGVYPNEKVE
jgi:SH3-like domain-containing protein